MRMPPAVLAIVVDGMIVARGGLEGQELRLGDGAGGQGEGLAHMKLLKIAARCQAMPVGVERLAHGVLPRGRVERGRGTAKAAPPALSPRRLATSSACR